MLWNPPQRDFVPDDSYDFPKLALDRNYRWGGRIGYVTCGGIPPEMARKWRGNGVEMGRKWGTMNRNEGNRKKKEKLKGDEEGLDKKSGRKTKKNHEAGWWKKADGYIQQAGIGVVYPPE